MQDIIDIGQTVAAAALLIGILRQMIRDVIALRPARS